MAPASDQHQPDPASQTPDRARLLRLGVPPAVSLAVHALLLGLIILIGVGIEHAPTERPRLAEIRIDQGSIAQTPDLAPAIAAPLPTPQPSASATPTSAARSPAQFESAATDLGTRGTTALPRSNLNAPSSSLTNPSSARTPTASFAGLEARAAGRIVYVVDASGAVVPTLTYIKRRLAQSIDRLAPTQKFEIIFFREPATGADDVQPRPRFASELVPATARTRARAAAWIDTIYAAGRSDPSQAIAEALALKPDLVFLLSTSIQRTQTDASNERSRLLALLDGLNPKDPRTGQRPVVIKALQFLRPDPANLLRDIAFLHGDGEGSYRLLTATQLDAADPEATDTQPISTNPYTSQAARQLADLDTTAWPVVLGLPTNPERENVRTAAGSTLDTLDRTPQNARDARWAHLHRRATLLHDATAPGGPDRERLTRAAAAPTRGVLSDPAADLERRLVELLIQGLAQGPQAQQPPREDSLGSLSREAAQAGFATLAVRAALGSIVSGEDASTPTSGIESAITPLLANDPRSRLLLAEALARAALQRDATAPTAFDPLLALIDDERLHPAASIRRSLAWGRVAAADDSFELDWSRMPAPAALARAAVLAQRASTKAQGLAALDAIANRSDAGGPEETRAQALWEGAIAERDLAQTNSPARARVSARLRQLVSEFPMTTHARDAAAAALALGTSDSGSLPPSVPSEFASLALDTFPDHPAADRWRLGLAHRAAGLPRLTILEQIPPGSPEEPNTLALYLQTVNELAAQPDTLTVLERALAYTHARGQPVWYELALRTAQTCESVNPERAAQLYLALGGAPPRDLLNAGVSQPPDDLRLTAGRALIASGQTASGVGVLTNLATRLEAANNRNAVFWRSWAMVLETLADSTDAAARSQGLAHATRLQLIDPFFGGGRGEPPAPGRVETARRIADAMHRLDSAHEHDPAHGSADPG